MKKFIITYLTHSNTIIEAISMEAAERQALKLLRENDVIFSIQEVKDEPTDPTG